MVNQLADAEGNDQERYHAGVRAIDRSATTEEENGRWGSESASALAQSSSCFG